MMDTDVLIRAARPAVAELSADEMASARAAFTASVAAQDRPAGRLRAWLSRRRLFVGFLALVVTPGAIAVAQKFVFDGGRSDQVKTAIEVVDPTDPDALRSIIDACRDLEAEGTPTASCQEILRRLRRDGGTDPAGGDQPIP
jgi:hypothetical protein